MPRDSDNDCRIYIGNLPPDIRTKDVEDLFYKFGDISFVDLKTRRGPPFAFVEFKDPRDAKEAVVSRDGYDYDGYKLRVEFPRGRERGPGGIFKGYREREGYSSSRKNGGGGPPTRRSNYRVKITGLPPTGSWQDLKDHMREAGEVCYADVFKDGSGVVEFLRRDDMRYAIKKLDDSRFRSHEGEVSYVRVAEDTGRGSFSSRSRSRSPKRSRASPTYSPAHDSRSPSRSRSRSSRDDDNDSDRDSRDSRSISRSRSRSPVRRHRTQSRSKSKSRSISRSRSRSRSVSRSYSRSRSSSR